MQKATETMVVQLCKSKQKFIEENGVEMVYLFQYGPALRAKLDQNPNFAIKKKPEPEPEQPVPQSAPVDVPKET